MQRRTLLKLGAGATVALALAGGGLALLQPVWVNGRLAPGAQAVVAAVARAVLDGSLPAGGAQRDAALQAHLRRFDDVVAAFPPPVRAELGQLLAMLSAAPGRVLFAGLQTNWPQASVAEVQAALARLRGSSLALRQQAYHALRDLTNAAFYADASSWRLLGYPGPRPV